MATEAPEPGESATRMLLREWYEGDRNALEELLRRNLPWLHQRVRQRLGDRLRRKAESVDIVQEAAIDLLEYGPRFLVSSEAQFRALLGSITENVLRGQSDWFNARRRALDRERTLASDSVLDLDARTRAVERPSEVVSRAESEAWVHLGVKLLEPRDQEVVYLRQFEGLSFLDVGERLGIAEDAARMRFTRALQRLGNKLLELQNGRIESAPETPADGPER